MTATNKLIAAALAAAFTAPVLAQDNKYPPLNPPTSGGSSTAVNNNVSTHTNNNVNNNATATGGNATAYGGNANVMTGGNSNNYGDTTVRIQEPTYIKVDAQNIGSCDGAAFQFIWQQATMGPRPHNLVSITPNSVTLRVGQYVEQDSMRNRVADRINRELNPQTAPITNVHTSMADSEISKRAHVNDVTTKPPVTDVIYMCTPK